MDTTCSIILAAGKGTRLKSELPKVLHEILAKPLIRYSLDIALGMSGRTIVIVGHLRDEVMERVRDAEVDFVVQEPQLGTGHAILTAKDAIAGAHSTEVLILPGDMPLIRKESVISLVEIFRREKAQVGILTAELDDPTGYGRIIRDDRGRITRIAEHSDASEEELRIREVNTSVYVMDAPFLLASVDHLSPDNAKAEFYLTDVIPMASCVVSFTTQDPDEAYGINSRSQLALAQKRMQRRINTRHLDEGVTLEDPDTTWIGPDVTIGPDTRIWPQVHILGACSLGRSVMVMPGVWIQNSVVGAGCVIGAGSVIRDASIPEGTLVAPHTLITGDGTAGSPSPVGTPSWRR